MTIPTLFAPEVATLGAGAELGLTAEEAGHARALRLAPGAELALTDGVGHRWLARLESLDRGSAICVLLREVAAPPALPVRLAFGVGNKDRTLWLVEKAVELGVEALEPLEFARSASVADAARSPRYWQRARRRALAALKQAGGSRLPVFEPVVNLDAWLTRPTEPGTLCLMADKTAHSGLGKHLEGWGPRSKAILLIGPEGGIEPSEAAVCRDAGFLAGRLGSHTLRFETAAVAALALVAERAARSDPSRGATAPEAVDDAVASRPATSEEREAENE